MKQKKEMITGRILDAAESLFYSEGIQSVGIDRVVKEAGVAVNTVYKYFPSKEILIAEYLKRRDVRWRTWFLSYTDEKNSPYKNILSLFDALNDWFNDPAFRGCAFINAAGEIGDRRSDIYKISRKHVEDVNESVLKFLEKGSYKDPKTVSEQIATLIEGAIVRAYVVEDKNAAVTAKNTARLILDTTDKDG